MPPGPWTAWSPEAASYRQATGTYARRLLDGDAAVDDDAVGLGLIGLAKRYSPRAAEAACARALDVDVINVSKIERVDAEERHREHPGGRAARSRQAAVLAGSPGECGRVRHRDREVRLQVVNGGGRQMFPAAAGPDLPRAICVRYQDNSSGCVQH